MTSAKTAQADTATRQTATTSIDNVISVTQWAETTAIARDGIFKCARELAELSRVTGQAMIGDYANYGNEVREIGSLCASAMITGLSEVGGQLTGEGAKPVKVEDSFSDMMKQLQRLMDANSRLTERQINSAAEAYQALAALPTCVLGSLDRK